MAPHPELSANVSVLYAQEAKIHLYSAGKDSVLGTNPAGYNSLDLWMGCSRSLGGVVFHRDFNGYFRLFEIDTSGRRLGKASAGIYVGKTPAEESSLDINPNDMGFDGRQLLQIRGKRHAAELWSQTAKGKWRKDGMWSLPGSAQYPGEWYSTVSRSHGWLAFFVPTGETESKAVLLRESDGTVNELGEGSFSVAISPDGRYVAFRSGDSTVRVVPLTGGPARNFRVWSTVEGLPLVGLSILGMGIVGGVQWVPGTQVLACEAEPAESGQSFIFLVDTTTGTTTHLPLMVERGQWCVLDLSENRVP